MSARKESSGLVIHSKGGRTDIYFNGILVNDKCLSFEVKADGPCQPRSCITLFCDEADMDVENVVVKKGGSGDAESKFRPRPCAGAA